MNNNERVAAVVCWSECGSSALVLLRGGVMEWMAGLDSKLKKEFCFFTLKEKKN
jgi:hypothetical protein